ncbi:hypothetical protein K435DRAFT_878011 [Dendrothele bispora CBS 962.96]|uniref:Integrase core domain-containing protein n=1 Tax=Dendrothele bispora (strain CBS 962.96) TaxID=1314807 RepID=A0A4S8KP64_DENBC|nr:hypothetical protein K435DRAFT_878011 [Dendrothele bispora CBS 962.96]
MLRSTQNVRIERLWLDIHKDTLEVFRKIFQYLQDNELLEMESSVHRIALFVVFQPRIQTSLDHSSDAWNHHRIRTARSKTPVAIWELSREYAINRGYWTGDPGDDRATANHPLYGVDGESEDTIPGDHQVDEEMDQVMVNDDAEIEAAKEILRNSHFYWEREDGNWGIEVFCEAVIILDSFVTHSSPES